MNNKHYFHGNHLSSGTWVSDVKGVACQHLQYEPYGAGWVDERTDEARSKGFSSRYRFTCKERDAESGLEYIGARYYWSGGRLWLSVDPLADNYPFLSPYVYGACSPVVLVDADGRGIWVFDERGNLIDYKESDYVIFYVVKVKNGKYTLNKNRSIDFAGQIIVRRWGQIPVENSSIKTTYFVIDDIENAKKLYHFLSEEITRPLGSEFGLMYNQVFSIVFTSHKPFKLYGAYDFYMDNFYNPTTEFLIFSHSHGGSEEPSCKDLKVRDLIMEKHREVGKIKSEFYIYKVPEKKEIPYTDFETEQKCEE